MTWFDIAGHSTYLHPMSALWREEQAQCGQSEWWRIPPSPSSRPNTNKLVHQRVAAENEKDIISYNNNNGMCYWNSSEMGTQIMMCSFFLRLLIGIAWLEWMCGRKHHESGAISEKKYSIFFKSPSALRECPLSLFIALYYDYCEYFDSYLWTKEVSVIQAIPEIQGDTEGLRLMSLVLSWQMFYDLNRMCRHSGDTGVMMTEYSDIWWNVALHHGAICDTVCSHLMVIQYLSRVSLQYMLNKLTVQQLWPQRKFISPALPFLSGRVSFFLPCAGE